MSGEIEQGIIVEAAQTGFAAASAENSLIGSIVDKYAECAHIVSELQPEDFYYEDNRIALRAVKQALNEGLTVDLISIDAEIRKMDPEKGMRAANHLIDCYQKCSPWAAESHCRIVKALAARRRAIALVGKTMEELKDPTKALNGIVDALRTESGDLMTGNHRWVTMRDVLTNTYDYIDRRVRGEIRSITTGIQNLNDVVGGFFGGELTVIGARPAVGKSVFGMNVALAAAKQGYRVGIVSREMTDVQYGQRMLSYASGVDGSKIRKAKLDVSDWEAIAEGLGPLSNLNMEFLFTVRTVDDLRAELQRKVNRGEIDMLIVDYLQLMDTAQKYKEDRLRVGGISKALKDMAVDFNIPVIALAQVKRFAGGARAKMPTLEDLKDSGSIEQDADNVIFLHNPYDQEDEFVDPRDRESFQAYIKQGYTYLCLGVAKQRQGATGKCCVLFDKRKMRYYTIDRTGEQTS